MQRGAQEQADVGKRQQPDAKVDEREPDDFERVHEDVADDENVVEAGRDSVQPRCRSDLEAVPPLIGDEPGEEALGDEKKGHERGEGDPDGQRNEDDVDET